MKFDRLHRHASLHMDVEWQEICSLFEVPLVSGRLIPYKAKLRLIRKLNAVYYWKRSHA